MLRKLLEYYQVIYLIRQGPNAVGYRDSCRMNVVSAGLATNDLPGDDFTGKHVMWFMISGMSNDRWGGQS